ncbi:MAG: hypothetical protein K8S55_12600 [Phycisphaerae bacterium]|nr:hypothetical protein [Phycisphaerae bacterium]
MTVNHKQNMLSVIAGQPTDCMPWAPRLDLWYKANKLAGTLPDEYQDAPLTEIVDGLSAGMHAIIPDFKDLRTQEDETDRALGVYNLWSMPYRTVFENIDRTVRIEGDNTFVDYDTPVGKISTVTVYDESMRKAGTTITHVKKQAFVDASDYEALGFIFENARVEPNYEGYAKFADSIGDRGLAAAFVSLSGSPMHLIQRELMPVETFFYEMHDRSNQLYALAEKISVYWNRVLEVVADCPAELVLCGANYDASVTYPPFFHEHIEPWLCKFADMLHARGKYITTHTDGENTGLLQHYIDSHIDVADSVCPAPMTQLTFKETRDFFDGRITIMGGIPSVALLPLSMPDREFDAFLDKFFKELGSGDHLILGISDTTPPNADFGRLQKISKRVQEFEV